MGAIVENKKDTTFLNKRNILKNELMTDYYIDYYNAMSSGELDKHFVSDIKMLSKVFNRLSDSQKKSFYKLFANIIEFYLKNKIEKEINNSFIKILKF